MVAVVFIIRKIMMMMSCTSNSTFLWCSLCSYVCCIPELQLDLSGSHIIKYTEIFLHHNGIVAIHLLMV